MSKVTLKSYWGGTKKILKIKYAGMYFWQLGVDYCLLKSGTSYRFKIVECLQNKWVPVITLVTAAIKVSNTKTCVFSSVCCNMYIIISKNTNHINLELFLSSNQTKSSTKVPMWEETCQIDFD